MSQIGFRFQGGIASRGQLSFYEAGRYRYAAARLLYTAEHFRKTGEVLERLSVYVEADFRVTAPIDGSFLENVWLYAAPAIADAKQIQSFLKIPFDKLFPYIWSKLIPSTSGSQQLAKIAETQADAIQQMAKASQERERTAQVQATQETERLRIIATLLRADTGGTRDNRAEAEEISEILAKRANSPARILTDDGTGDFIADELKAENNRNNLLEEVQEEMNRVDPEGEDRIVEKMRKLVPDLAQPLKRSATKMSLEVTEKAIPIAILNSKRVAQISHTAKDEHPIRLNGNMIKLDKETGYGRFRPTGARTPLSFTIPREIFNLQRASFIGAFTSREISVEALPYRDGIGNITKLILLRVL
ncbi:hypothetical protein [Muricoccus pecuniae]|uniref:Uncharacterized protein n=1 Tax=Muricoccus pecuniae TaxID=693023 RepID=A0A840Y3I6_9PROT|nr:hypothetical protein [Roseomonas pecuniae]MBB5693339.1 hypothetical protein [Roseomonas pecuniae]